MIRLFASDLDGTLLNAMHETDRTIRHAIGKAQALGAHVVPATGRSTLPAGERGFSGLALDSVCANGSIVRGPRGEVLKTFELDRGFVEELLRAFPQICFDCCTPDGIYSSGSYEMHQAGFKRDGLVRRIAMRGMRARGGLHEEHRFSQPLSEILSHTVCKVNCRVETAGLERELKAFLADHADEVVNAPFNPVMFEITDKSCNKGESVAWLGRHYGIGEDEIAVYGDGGNDIAMLALFARYGHAYATANGSAAAKQASGNVIGHCALHAVPKHILKTLREGR